MKELIKRIPVIGEATRRLYSKLAERPAFPGSEDYWKTRYEHGGNSGAGSYGKFAEFKAEVLNGFVARLGIESVIEFGCGDGNQLRLARYPSYMGFDVSENAVAACRRIFAGDPAKSFRTMGDYGDEKADLALSLDVLYHLVEDAVFEKYMRTLFRAGRRHVIVYSSDSAVDGDYKGTHVKHRNFTAWVAKNIPQWALKERMPNRYPYRGDYTQGSFADFYFYEKPGKN